MTSTLPFRLQVTKLLAELGRIPFTPTGSASDTPIIRKSGLGLLVILPSIGPSSHSIIRLMILIVCRLIVYTKISFSQETGWLNDMYQIAREFGHRIRKLREAKGLSQEELAFRAHVHRTYLGGIERGERNPSLKNITAIARALEINLSELFLIEEAKPKRRKSK